jgi:YebC/PmpR family DNA-binding regulatory protein
MAGHSQFKNIMYRKGAQDAKRAKMFTRLIKEIHVAAKSGAPDPDANPRLRAAINAAKQANMPKDNVERAIQKATGGGDDTDYTEMRYEGYGPAGVAIIVEALTDNRNRTAAEVRATFSKYGGSLGETNSVSFMFNRRGEIAYDAAAAGDFDTVFEAALEAGAEDVESGEDGVYTVTCAPDDFARVRDTMEEKLGPPQSAELTWRPMSTVAVDEEPAGSLFKLLDALDDNEDVQRVAANYEISDDVMARLTAA